MCKREAQGRWGRKSRSVAMLARVWLCLLLIFLKLLDLKRKARLPRSCVVLPAELWGCVVTEWIQPVGKLIISVGIHSVHSVWFGTVGLWFWDVKAQKEARLARGGWRLSRTSVCKHSRGTCSGKLSIFRPHSLYPFPAVNFLKIKNKKSSSKSSCKPVVPLMHPPLSCTPCSHFLLKKASAWGYAAWKEELECSQHRWHVMPHPARCI